MLLVVASLKKRACVLAGVQTITRPLETYEHVDMLRQQSLSVVQLIESNVDVEVFLGQSHVLVHFERVVKVADVTERVQKVVHARLVVFHKPIQACHVGFFGVRGLVGQVLQHLGNQGQRPPGVFGGRRQLVDQHVGVWCDDGRVDEAEEEKAADEGADTELSCVGVFALKMIQ